MVTSVQDCCAPQRHRWHALARPRTIQLGELRVSYVVDGVLAFEPELFFPAIPKAYWRRHPEQLDRSGRVVMSVGAVLVEAGDRALLIDTGWGSFNGEVIFGHVRSGQLPRGLSQLGHSEASIDTVAFTHLHIDHVGWSAQSDERETRPMFPHARYLVSTPEWSAYQRGEVRIDAPSTVTMLDAFAPRVRQFDEGSEIFPHVTALITPGHSPGHTSYIITAGAQRLIVFGDVFHVPAQLAHPEWTSAPDEGSEEAVRARHRLLAELAKPNTIGFGFHFADVPFGRYVPGASVAWAPLEEHTVLTSVDQRVDQR